MKSLWLLVLGLAAPALASEPATCEDSATYHRLDFWVGEWDVFSDGQLVGTNAIEKILSGCAVLEHWTGAGGGQGKSLFYVDDQGTWKQVWVTQQAIRAGGIKEKVWQSLDADDSVRFQGKIHRDDGAEYLDRTTLTRLDNGDVRQLIELSTDGGENWQPTFDAIYRPK